MNSSIAKLLLAMNQMLRVESPVKRPTRNLGHNPTRQKKGPTKKGELTNERRRALAHGFTFNHSQKEPKKRRKMAAKSRKINRLRGVGV